MSVRLAIRVALNPVVLLSFLTLLTGGSTARFYAYQEPGALPSLVVHLSLALALALVAYIDLYKRYKGGSDHGSEALLLLLVLAQLGLGSLLGVYRLGLIDLGGRVEVFIATGAHFLISLLVFMVAVITSVRRAGFSTA